MDTIQHIEKEVQSLHELKEKIQHEIDSLQTEIYSVKATDLGFGPKFKTMMTRIMSLSHGMGGTMAEVYHHAIDGEYENAQEYVDSMKQTQSNLRDLMSKIDQVIANLEKCKNDLEYKLRDVESWMIKAKELL